MIVFYIKTKKRQLVAFVKVIKKISVQLRNRENLRNLSLTDGDIAAFDLFKDQILKQSDMILTETYDTVDLQ